MKNIKEKITHGLLYSVIGWTIFGLSFQIFMLVTTFTNPQLSTKIGNELMWKFDGTFKNNPNNIWYEKKIK